jgi:hypothetical protein
MDEENRSAIGAWARTTQGAAATEDRAAVCKKLRRDGMVVS